MKKHIFRNKHLKTFSTCNHTQFIFEIQEIANNRKKTIPEIVSNKTVKLVLCTEIFLNSKHVSIAIQNV